MEIPFLTKLPKVQYQYLLFDKRKVQKLDSVL